MTDGSDATADRRGLRNLPAPHRLWSDVEVMP